MFFFFCFFVGHAHQDSFDLLQLREPTADHKLLDYRHQKQRRKAHSLVGTPNYIAPEVLLRTGKFFWKVIFDRASSLTNIFLFLFQDIINCAIIGRWVLFFTKWSSVIRRF